MLKANLLVEAEGRSYESFQYFEENLLNVLDYDEMNDWEQNLGIKSCQSESICCTKKTLPILYILLIILY